jgi:hypothetical protein
VGDAATFRTPFAEDRGCARLRGSELEADDPRSAGVFQTFVEQEIRKDREDDSGDTE